MQIVSGILSCVYLTACVSLTAMGALSQPSHVAVQNAQLGSLVHIVAQLWAENQGHSDQTHVPLTFGHVFAPGGVPSGAALAARLANGAMVPLQIDAKATHADGSLRHAVLTALLPTVGGHETQALELLTVTPSLSGVPLAVSDLLATNFDALVVFKLGEKSYQASVRDLLQTNTAQIWLAGPLVTEWMVTAPVQDTNGQVHPHLTVRFAVRAYQGMQRVRVDVIVENTWAYEPQPHNFTYDVTVTVSGTQVYTKHNLIHYRQARWRKVFWWGAEPQMHLRHDTAYLLATGAVANYDTRLAIPDRLLNALAAEWAGDKIEPMGIGLAIPYMPTTGGRRDIGPLPSWAVHYLLSMDPRAKIPTLGMGALAGSWPIHYRDKHTDLPVSLVDYPYMTLLGKPGDTVNPQTGKSEAFPQCGGDCSTPYKPDSAHQPDFAYVPYLVTGDYYYLEELHFWANYNLFESNPFHRAFAKGLLKWGQVRGQAWALRTLGYTAYITPDKHPLKPYFLDRVSDNLTWYRQQYSDNPNANLLGFITNGYAMVYHDGRGIASWQDDFFTWSVGHLVDLGFTEALPLLQWKAKFPVGRMTAPGYCWIFAAYGLNVRADKGSTFYPTFAEAYIATVDPKVQDLPCAGQAMAKALGLKNAGEMVGYASSTVGYPANMQPALAVAAQSGTPNAAEAWVLFSNRLVKPDYTVGPQFAIVPRHVSTPITTPTPGTSQPPPALSVPPRQP